MLLSLLLPYAMLFLAASPELAGLPRIGAPAIVPYVAWDGERRVVHEWGTFTTVVGSDGVALEGLLHDPFGLPEFVYDLTDEMALTGLTPKMETPVVYLYSPEEWRVRVRVDFPHGLITQWYPAPSRANLWEQGLLTTPRYSRRRESGLEPWGPRPVPDAAERRAGPLEGGMIDWGRFGDLHVLAPDAEVDLPPVELDDPWRFAREVRANPLRVSNSSYILSEGDEARNEDELFLFYRGLGDFELPLVTRVLSEVADETRCVVSLELENTCPEEALQGLFLLYVERGRGGFVALPDVTHAYTASDVTIPLVALEHSTAALVDQLAATLVNTGLYTDEAFAMARTWQSSWFEDEGLRVLYVLPPALVDRELPLSVQGRLRGYVDGKPVRDPGADEIVRTFVGRIDLLSPEREARALATVEEATFGTEAERANARASVRAWGRTGVPVLRRLRALGAPADVLEVAGAWTLEGLGRD